jgi:hypothetical protein
LLSAPEVWWPTVTIKFFADRDQVACNRRR